MRWTPGDRSNIDDKRGQLGRRRFPRMIPLGIGGFIVVALLSMFTGVDFFSILGGGGGRPEPSARRSAPRATSPPRRRKKRWSTWSMRSRATHSRRGAACWAAATSRPRSCCSGIRSSLRAASRKPATGPFYCPGRRKVYLDLGFFDELQQRFGASGDFAQAYVLAHEIGHHVQTPDRHRSAGAPGAACQSWQRERAVGPPRAAGRLLCRRVGPQRLRSPAAPRKGEVELDPGDVEEALHAAAAIGDDRLQKLATGRVMPEKFTHGSSEQRVTWFKRGLRQRRSASTATRSGNAMTDRGVDDG